jgi:hypothetical protein
MVAVTMPVVRSSLNVAWGWNESGRGFMWSAAIGTGCSATGSGNVAGPGCGSVKSMALVRSPVIERRQALMLGHVNGLPR